jgi:Ion channel
MPDGNFLTGYKVSPTSAPGSGEWPPPLDTLLPGPESVYPTNAEASVIYVSINTALAIERLSASGAGDPKEVSDLFVRMCYLSVVTITTLGYGDITPVSSRARALVAAEAVWGVVLIGLFLNAVAQKWGKRS